MTTTSKKSKKGISVSVYRRNDDPGTNRHFTLIDESVQGPHEPVDGYPEINLVRRQIAGREYVHAVPAALADKQVMFGGTFIYTSDSRFPSSYPIPVHDRVEY